MIILALRTDNPIAELYLYKDQQKLAGIKWQAHKELSKTIHTRIKKLLDSSSINLQQLEGIVCFKGPGSFTGLRIGMSVANALAYANQIPIVAQMGDDWLASGIKDLLAGKNDKIAIPFYDRPPATSTQKS